MMHSRPIIRLLQYAAAIEVLIIGISAILIIFGGAEGAGRMLGLLYFQGSYAAVAISNSDGLSIMGGDPVSPLVGRGAEKIASQHHNERFSAGVGASAFLFQ